MSEIFPSSEKASDAYHTLIMYCVENDCNYGCIFWSLDLGRCPFLDAIYPCEWLPLKQD